MPLSRYGWTFEPCDLDLLQQVFDRLCDERRLTQKDRNQREALAEEVIRVFQSGIRDEAELRRALSQPGKTFSGKP